VKYEQWSNETGKWEIKNFWDCFKLSRGGWKKVKIILQLGRQNLLVLSRIIERGLEADQKETKGDILMLLSREGIDEFRKVVDDILQKGELTNFYENLKSL